MTSLFDAPAFNAALFFPRRDVSPSPAHARDLFVSVADGVRVHVRLHARPGSAALVLLFHGNGEVVADYDGLAPHYHRAGADLAVAGFRGYGASEGTPTYRGIIADARPVARAVREAAPALPFVVMGRSLGSACAAELADADRALAGLVWESGPTDLAGLARRRGFAAPAGWTEEELATFDPLRKLARCAAPALVLHGAEDALIRPDEGRAALDALASRDKELVLVPGRGHNDLALHPDYWDALARLVARVARA